MITKEECKKLNERMEGTLVRTLGIEFLPSDNDEFLGVMPINSATRQYFGVVHGGAYLAFAETLAGAASCSMVSPDVKVCGIQVTGNHIAMSPTEGFVYGKATLVQAGATLHIWNVDITDANGKLLSTERVTNYVLQ